MPEFKPWNEDQRLADLKATGLLDSEPCESFEAITSSAHNIFNVDVAGVSLMDADRQWFKSIIGLPVREVPRDLSFCNWVVDSEKPIIVTDALQDARFSKNPFVLGPPFVRFYSGTPLYSKQGRVLGTLCLLHSERRELTKHEIAQLQSLARRAEALLHKASS